MRDSMEDLAKRIATGRPVRKPHGGTSSGSMEDVAKRIVTGRPPHKPMGDMPMAATGKAITSKELKAHKRLGGRMSDRLISRFKY